MANVRKRILQLTPLPSASLDTTIVGVDNGVTYRIELDVLADAVTSRVNILDRDRLNSLESVTSSFESKGRSIISSSAQISAFGFTSSSVTIPTGTISSSTQITSFGFISESVDITSLNSFTSSQSTLNTAFTNGIIGRLTTSSFNEYTASQSTSSLIDRLNTIESETGSYLISLNGAISSSSQLTSSFDTRYTLSGSIVNVDNSSLVTTSSFNSYTSSQDSKNTAFTNGISARLQTSSFNDYTSSLDGRFNGLVTTGSNTFSGSQIFSGSMTVTSGQVIASTITNNSSSLFLQSGSNLYVQNDGIVEITGSLTATSITGSIAATNGVISGSSQLTTAFPSKTIGSWSVPAGASIQSFTVEAGHTYSMWINGNIPNGIITWNATATLSNTNVPAVGSQYGWYYVDGNALVLTSMPDQIIGTNGGIITSPSSYAPTTSNVFKFGITNNSGTTQTINYGYIKIS